MPVQPTVLITRRSTFSAGHILRNEDWDDDRNQDVFGGCSHEHGHNYVLEVSVSGPVAPDTGMVMNLKEVEQVLHDRVVADVDHRHLNRDVDWMRGILPTTENLALAIWNRLEPCLEGRLARVRVRETEKNWVEVAR